MRGLVASVALIAACYAPTPNAGAPCAAPGAPARCPAGQICVLAGGEERCQLDPDDLPGSPDAPSPPGDRDADGVLDVDDNCPDRANPLQDNEDNDGFGDACDPCPIDAGATDSDGDGVANACDPHDNLADRIVLFESFQQGIPASWTRTGTWSASNGEARVVAGADVVATLRLDAPITDRTKITAAVIVESAAGASADIDVVNPVAPDDGVTCSLFHNLASGDTTRELALYDLGGDASVLTVANAWTDNTTYQLSLDRNVNNYRCGIRLGSSSTAIGSSLARAFPQPAVGLRSHGVTARVAWVLVVATP